MDFLIVESDIKHHNLKRVKVMVFNATFNNKKIPEDLSIRGLRLWCLMPLSTKTP
jgi:hypothetical protein